MFELSGYETLDLIGGGGFGEVWLAAQNSTGRNVAVKVAHAPISDETLQIRFEREYKALGRLSGHPNIVDIVTAGTLRDGRAFLVLEYIDGGTLWDRSERRDIEEDNLISIGIGLAKALKSAHSAGVLHRDVKPENVMLRDNGEAVLSDFGLAHLTDGATTSQNAVVASVAYAAPEILSGEGASTSTDIYGLGVCLLTAAIRSVPFVQLHDKSIQTVIQRVLSQPPPNIVELGYSSLFNTLVSDLMSKEAQNRPATADDALKRLEELPQLRGDQAFSWSDFLQAPESEPKTAEPITVQMDAIEVDEPPAETKDFWWAPTPSSEVGSDPESTSGHENVPAGSDANIDTPSDTGTLSPLAGGPTDDDALDEIDQLINELTTSDQRGQSPEETIKPVSDEGTTDRLEPASGADSEPAAASEQLTKASDAPTTSAKEKSETALFDQDPDATETTNNHKSEKDTPAPNQGPKTDDDSRNQSGEDDYADHGDKPDQTIQMPAITIGQPPLASPPSWPTTQPKNPSPNTSSPQSQWTSPDKFEGDTSRIGSAVVDQAPGAESHFGDANVKVSELPKVADSETPESLASPKPLATESEPATKGDDVRPFKRLFIGLGILALLSLLAALILNALLTDSGDDNPSSPQPSGETTQLVLPISIDAEGLAEGTVEASTPSLGPASPLFCDNALDATGMTTWKGSQFFTPDDAGSIEQLVVGFDDATSAGNYFSEIEDSLECDNWNQTLNGTTYAHSAEVAGSPITFGDRSTDFDVAASAADGSEALGKTYVVQSGPSVAVIAVRAQDRGSFDELATIAEQASESFGEGTT